MEKMTGMTSECQVSELNDKFQSVPLSVRRKNGVTDR